MLYDALSITYIQGKVKVAGYVDADKAPNGKLVLVNGEELPDEIADILNSSYTIGSLLFVTVKEYGSMVMYSKLPRFIKAQGYGQLCAWLDQLEKHQPSEEVE